MPYVWSLEGVQVIEVEAIEDKIHPKIQAFDSYMFTFRSAERLARTLTE